MKETRLQGRTCDCLRIPRINLQKHSSSIDGKQNLVGGQITGDLEHERERGAGELKEDDEGVSFYLLPVVEMDHSGGN